MVVINVLTPTEDFYYIVSPNLLVADKAAIGNCSDTVKVRSDPVGNITDRFLLDFATLDSSVWFVYLMEVSLANFREVV